METILGQLLSKCKEKDARDLACYQGEGRTGLTRRWNRYLVLYSGWLADGGSVWVSQGAELYGWRVGRCLPWSEAKECCDGDNEKEEVCSFLLWRKKGVVFRCSHRTPRR